MKIFFERRPTLMGQTSFSSVDPGQRRVYSDLEILEDFLGKPSKLNHCKNGFFSRLLSNGGMSFGDGRSLGYYIEYFDEFEAKDLIIK